MTNYYTPLIQKAIRCAIETHELNQKQKRKGKDIPYITHPLTVGLILARAGASEDAITAGILHDTIEDSSEEHKISPLMISELFSEKISDLVLSVTETRKDLPWEARKRMALDKIDGYSHESILIKSADILSNGNELLDDIERDGEAVFVRFNADKESVLLHYLRVIARLVYRWPDSPLALDLAFLAPRLLLAGRDVFILKYKPTFLNKGEYRDITPLTCPVCSMTRPTVFQGNISYVEGLYVVHCPLCNQMLLVSPDIQ